MKFRAINEVSCLLAIMCGAGGLVSCGGSGSGAGEGYLSVSVTDAPVDDITSVVVEFSGISIKPADGEALEFNFEAKTIDLLDLQGTLSEPLLSDEPVPAGSYEWIRLHVNAEHDTIMDSYVETDIGTQTELWVPSGSQSGLKLVQGFTVLAGGFADFTVDFDLRKSLVTPPGLSSQGMLLKPVLRLVDNVEAGSILGIVDSTLVTESCVDPANEYGAVYLYSGTDVIPTDVSGSESDPLTSALLSYNGTDYNYEIGFLPPGDYTLAYTCEANMDDPATVDEITFTQTANVSVNEGEQTIFDISSTTQAEAM